MRWRNSQLDFGAIARSAHWASALFVLFAWLLETYRGYFPRGAPRDTALSIHIALGLGVLALVVFRLIWRALDPPPPEIGNARFDPWLGRVAKAGHGLLYLLLIVTPILGIVLQFSRGQPLPVFGIVSIPTPWPTLDRNFFDKIIGLHQFAANALGVVAIGHAAAALIHHWLLRDRTLARMLPGIAR
jgi:cytochrome b561